MVFASLLLLFATVCMAVEHWRQKHRVSRWTGWMPAEFDALNAGGVRVEHPENTYPEFTQGSARFEGEALGHLLPESACIRNDVRLNAATRVYIVSGPIWRGRAPCCGPSVSMRSA